MIYRIIIFLVIFLISLFKLAPTVTVGDSGEFITNAVTLGIVHSPGYPLYSILGKIFSILIPFGNLGYRINLSSSIFVATLFSLFPLKNLLSVIIIFSIFLSKIFLQQSAVTEVFILNALFCVILWRIIFSNLSSNKKLYLFSFFAGLGLGNHHTLLLFIFSLFILYLLKERRFSLYAVLFFILGFSVYIFLHLRSLKNPPLDWGNTEKIQNLIRVITRKDYGTFKLTVEEKKEIGLNEIINQSKRFFLNYFHNVTIFPLIVLGIILFFLMKRSKSLSIMFVFLFSITGIFLIIFSNLPYDEQSEGILERFYLMPIVVNGLIIAEFLQINTKINRLCLLLLILAIIKNIFSFGDLSRRYDFLAFDYVKNLFKSMEENSVFIMDGGDDTFYTSAYWSFAQKKKNIQLHDRGGLVFKNIYGDDFRQLSKDEKEKRRQSIEYQILKSNKPLYYSTMNEKILPDANLYLIGVVWKAHLQDNITMTKLWELYSYRSVYLNEFPEYRNKALAPVYIYLKFKEKLSEKKWDEAIKMLKINLAISKGVPWAEQNIFLESLNAGIEVFNSNPKISENFFETALKIKPQDEYALVNLGAVKEKLNKLDEAKEIYAKLLELNPNNINGLFNLSVIYWKEKNWQKVYEIYKKILSIKPDEPMVIKYLPYVQHILKEKEK